MRLDPGEAARIEASFDAAQAKTRAPVVCVLASASLARDAEFLLGAAALALATPLPLLLFTEMSAQRIYIAQLLVAILAAVVGSLPWARFERRLACEKMIERAVEPILVDLLIAKLEQIAKRKLLKLASNCASWVGSSILKFESDQAAWSSL